MPEMENETLQFVGTMLNSMRFEAILEDSAELFPELRNSPNSNMD